MYKFLIHIRVACLFVLLFPFLASSQTVLWQNDFSDPNSWIIDNNGQSGGQFGWTIDATSDGWWSPNGINSTSGGNYGELSNGDPTLTNPNQALGVIYTMTTTNPINISGLGGSNLVSLQFQQFGARFNDLQEIQISTDGVNFTTVDSNLDHPILSSTGGSPYPNPENVSINLSQFLPSNPTNVWIRFSWTTAYPGNESNPNVWITYGWYIDDVKITTLPNYDLTVSSESWGTNGLQYYQIPLSQVQPITFSATINNEGQQTMNNVSYNIDVNNSQYLASSQGVSIPILSSINENLTFTPSQSTISSYTISRYLTSNQTDMMSENNSIPDITLNVTDDTYARDDGTFSGYISNGYDYFEVGNLFEVFQSTGLSAIDVRVHSGSTAGIEIFARIYSIDPGTGDFVFEAESDPFFLSVSNINTLVSIPMGVPYNLTAGQTYLIAVGSYEGLLRVSRSIPSIPSIAWFKDIDDVWYQTSDLPIIRMRLCNINNSSSTLNISSCESYISPAGNTYTSSGIYTDVIPVANGCGDSTITINLTINNSVQSSFSATICGGESYTWNDQTYDYSGLFTQTFPAANGCDSIVTLNLTVNYNDYIQIQANPTFGNSPLNVAFNNQTQNLSNYNFTWYFGDGTSQQSNSPFLSHTYTQDAYSDVTVVAENLITGCVTSSTYEDMIFVIGGVTCTHEATISETGPIQACSGDTVTLTCNTDPSFSYQWNRNGVPISGATGSIVNVTLSGSYTVTIYQNSCPVTSSGITVTVNPLPNAPVITSTGTINSCTGGSMTLIAPAGFSTYEWNTGATSSSIIVNSSGNYTVVVTNGNGCSNSSAPFAVNASFIDAPSVCVVGMDSLTNENRVVWEKPMTEGIDSFYVYRETNVSDVYTQIGATDYDELAVFLDVNSNPAVQAYRYKITALDTCGTETNLSDFHKTIHLTINAGIGGAWNLIWSHYEGIDFGSYNIYRGTDPSNIALLTTIQSNLNSYSDLTPPAGAVYYQIEIVNPNSCDPTRVVGYDVSRSNIVNNGENGIESVTINDVHIYPNPTAKDLTIEINPELIGKEYFLTDNTGRIILSGQFRATKETINMEEVAAGVYFINVNGKTKSLHKIVKN
jgi:hypothetical protein